jgi:hypothetical protein
MRWGFLVARPPNPFLPSDAVGMIKRGGETEASTTSRQASVCENV